MRAALHLALTGLLLPAAVQTARAALADGIKAVVHDRIITHEQVEDLTDQTLSVLRSQYAYDLAAYRQKLGETRAENLQKLLERELILHEFKTAGYAIPESVIDDLLRERIRAVFGDRRKAAKTLQMEGMTFERFRERERERLVLDLMRQKNLAPEKIIISPHKIETYYNENLAKYQLDDEVKLRTIILQKQADDAGESTLQKAKELLVKVKEGVPFAELAQMYSDAGTRTNVRDWEQISNLRKELAEPLSKLKVGEVSDLIDTPDSYWIVKVEDKRSARPKTLAEMRDQIEKELSLAEQKRLEDQWIAKLRKKTFVRLF